ncbi:MAG TPA: ATP-binding protein, partial [Bacillota bacterium]|nr:ATP-binding protein [Bacillota bacterium]
IRGVVHFSRLSNLKFEPDDVWILTILTQRANMALESAELYQNLKKSEKRFKDIAFSSADWIWELDEKGVYTYCSEKVEELLGYQREEIIGKTPFDFMPPEEAERNRAIFDQILQNREQIKDLENWNLSKNGRRICFLTNGVPILDEQNQLIGYRGVDKDITESKQAEITLKEIMEDLKRSNIELEQFAFIASHDLQEPLRKIRMFSDKLQNNYRQVLDEKGADYLQRMNNAAVRLETLVQGLLEYSRVSTKLQPFEPIDLNEVIKEVLGDMEIRINETNAKIIIENLPTMNGDPLQMRQLFQNLIGNAIKYYRENVAPVIKIHSRRFKEFNQEYYEIQIIDNGIGFENIYAEKIFGLFQRLHGRIEYEGAGLGLSICRKIVTRHGGNITANSKPGEGSTFTIKLPVN